MFVSLYVVDLHLLSCSLLECHQGFHDPFRDVMLRRHHRWHHVLFTLFLLWKVQSLICCRNNVFRLQWVKQTHTYVITVQCMSLICASSFIRQLSLFCWEWPSTLEWQSTSWEGALVIGASPGPTYWAGWPCSWTSLQVRKGGEHNLTDRKVV